MDRFGKGVKALNKLEASGLIDELLVQMARPNRATGAFKRQVDDDRHH
jgi:hypothetical protein